MNKANKVRAFMFNVYAKMCKYVYYIQLDEHINIHPKGKPEQRV